MRNKILTGVLGVALGLATAAVLDAAYPASAAPVTSVAPVRNVAVLVTSCEDTAADAPCAYYDDSDDAVGVAQWWLYPYGQATSDYRLPIAECPTEDSDTLTCLWPSYALGGYLVYLAVDLPSGR